MTSDRLRQAADRLEQPEWRRTTLTAIEQNRSTAALLRAVADSNHGSDIWYCDCRLCVAALTLADTILGVEE